MRSGTEQPGTASDRWQQARRSVDPRDHNPHDNALPRVRRQSARHVRTEKGDHELRTRRYGLSPRARQLLLLIDSRRDHDRLARVFPHYELSAYLALLENEGFVEQERPALPTPRLSPLEKTRESAMRRLLAVLGNAGEQFALRVAKCRTHAEFESLLPAIESVIEVRQGPDAARQFSRKVMVN